MVVSTSRKIIGDIAMGIGMALLEETVSNRYWTPGDHVAGRACRGGELRRSGSGVLFVGKPDSMTPLGIKGVGELAITGMARYGRSSRADVRPAARYQMTKVRELSSAFRRTTR